MAVSAPERDLNHLRAIIDMGSNGIRFSISTLQPPNARIMPTLYQQRVGISLYDAQYSADGERQPIDEKTISAVTSALKQFKSTCTDFGVQKEQIVVLATEATRTAINSEDFRKQIKNAVGWDVTLLPKEEEGRVGAMGIASSLPIVSGLVMDLGGGSTQLSWLISHGPNGVRMPKSGAVSMPYGAAAMSRRLAEAERHGTTTGLREEVKKAIGDAYASLKIPSELEETAKREGGFTLYLSGGGFRGWGYILMSRHPVQPYPIPVINGFKVSRKDFVGTDDVKLAAAATLQDEDDEIFRVSDRRAGQVPAVAFLINTLAEVLPQIKDVRFCQGGVREGYLFRSLDKAVQAQHPLVMASQPFSPTSSQGVLDLLKDCFPSGSTDGASGDYQSVFTSPLLESLGNMMYYHSSHSKDLQASSALRSTTSGILAGVHGLLHESRALLALLLCARWGGDVPPVDASFKKSLEQLVESPWTLWWINYVGAVAALIGSIFPAGVVGQSGSRLAFNARWDSDEKQLSILSLHVIVASGLDENVFSKETRDIEKVGKRKRWIGGREGVGHKVLIKVGTLGVT